MKKAKLLIADASAEFRQDVEQALWGTYQVHQASDGQQALQLLQSIRPDVLVLDMMLPGLDGISLLQKAVQQELRPTVLATTHMLNSYILQMLERFGVGYVMLKPCDAEAVAERVEDLTQSLQAPVLLSPDKRTQVSNLLRQLGVPVKLKGYGYLREAVELYADDPEQSITKELYCKVAQRCNATTVQVERSVRTAIETAWLHRDRPVWRRYFTGGDIARPTNGEFVAQLADCLLTRYGFE